jgi:hypothetical protein
MRQVRGMREGVGAIGLRWPGFRLGLRLSGNGMGETMAFCRANLGVWGYPEGEIKSPLSTL